jgi:hypothetical protein
VFANISQQFTYAYNANWQFAFQIPFQYRGIKISYNLLDGSPYAPPYAGIHHRNENLYGIGDAGFQTRYFRTFEDWTMGLSFGTSLPLGKIEEDPYLKGALGEVHQHFQMGTGTFIPNIGSNFIYQKDKIGYLLSFQGDISLYENKLYYISGSSLTWNLGLWYPWNPKSLSLVQLLGRHEGVDTWRDLPAPFSGRDALSIVWSQAIKTKKKQEIILRLDRLVFVNNRGDTQTNNDEGFPLYTTYSLGYTFF